MPKIIVTSRYIAPSVPKSHLEYYTKYIATRPGVVINNTNSVGIEPQKPSNPNDPVSEKQKQMIDQLLQDFKELKNCLNMRLYHNPTQGNGKRFNFSGNRQKCRYSNRKIGIHPLSRRTPRCCKGR